jgi:hypothetical protein
MFTLRSLTTCARPLNRLSALALGGLALSLVLIVGSSPAHAARRPGAAPSQTTKAPPVVPAQTRNALLSQLDRSLSKLGRRPTLQQLTNAPGSGVADCPYRSDRVVLARPIRAHLSRTIDRLWAVPRVTQGDARSV